MRGAVRWSGIAVTVADSVELRRPSACPDPVTGDCGATTRYDVHVAAANESAATRTIPRLPRKRMQRSSILSEKTLRRHRLRCLPCQTRYLHGPRAYLTSAVADVGRTSKFLGRFGLGAKGLPY